MSFFTLHPNIVRNGHFNAKIMLVLQGGLIVLKEVNNHWSENLIPSPNKKDLVFQHIKGAGMHLYVQQPNGGKKYVCSAEAKCKSHQRHFMKNTTTALYKHFLQQYPLRRGEYHIYMYIYVYVLFWKHELFYKKCTICSFAGIVTFYLYRKLKPFFACKPSLL